MTDPDALKGKIEWTEAGPDDADYWGGDDAPAVRNKSKWSKKMWALWWFLWIPASIWAVFFFILACLTILIPPLAMVMFMWAGYPGGLLVLWWRNSIQREVIE